MYLTVWGISSVGRAPALQAGGHWFEPSILHHMGRLAEWLNALVWETDSYKYYYNIGV